MLSNTKNSTNKQIKTIAVDLHALLAKGDNGGAKVFILDLLDDMANRFPDVKLVLLIREAVADEMRRFKQPNVVLNVQHSQLGVHSKTFFLKRFTKQYVAKYAPRLFAYLTRIWQKIRGAQNQKVTRSLLSELQADILFAPFTAIQFDHPNLPSVSIVYDLQYKVYPQFFDEIELVNRENVFQNACERATKIATISNYSRSHILDCSDRRQEDVKTIYLQMAKRKDVSADVIRNCLHHYDSVEKQYIIYPANFWRHKNHEMLLVSFAQYKRKYKNCNLKLILTGADVERGDFLRTSVSKMGISQFVIFAGFVPPDDLTALMKMAKGLIFPSLFEGFGIPLVEAMISGVPVACSNCTSLPEVGREAAIYFDPRQPADVVRAITELCQGNQRARIQLGMEVAKAFSDRSKMTLAYWDLFNEALQHKIPKDEVTGIYDDGWCADKIKVRWASLNFSLLRLSFDMPHWLDYDVLSASVFDAKGQKCTVRLSKQSNLQNIIEIPLSEQNRFIEIRFQQSFIPNDTSGNSDYRKLSVRCHSCVLIDNHFKQNKELLS